MLARTLKRGGADVRMAAANPLSTQDDVVEALDGTGVAVSSERGEGVEQYVAHVKALAGAKPDITLDDGADLVTAVNAAGHTARGGTEETTTGIVRLRHLAEEGGLRYPILAVNEARTERTFNDRHGTGQSALDGILRATNILLAGHTLVLLGYGFAGKGVAERARGAGAAVVVCEVDAFRALEARMDGFEVMPILEAAERGDIFVTVTGSKSVLRAEHFERMKDGALLANAGHFDVEIDIAGLSGLADGPSRQVLPLVEEFDLGGKRVHLLANGRVVNLAAARWPPGLGDGRELRPPGAGGGAPGQERRRAGAQGAGRAPRARRRGGPAEARGPRCLDRRAHRGPAALPDFLGLAAHSKLAAVRPG